MMIAEKAADMIRSLPPLAPVLLEPEPANSAGPSTSTAGAPTAVASG
jgi:hypothetical protein